MDVPTMWPIQIKDFILCSCWPFIRLVLFFVYFIFLGLKVSEGRDPPLASSRYIKLKLKRMLIIHILEMLAGLILEGRLRQFQTPHAAAEELRERCPGSPGRFHFQCTYEFAVAAGSAEEEGGRSEGWWPAPGAAASVSGALGQTVRRSELSLAAQE